jgi:hypothetical protein
VTPVSGALSLTPDTGEQAATRFDTPVTYRHDFSRAMQI